MARYTLPVTVTLRGYVDVEADDAAEAKRLFHDEIAGLDESLTYEQTWELQDWECTAHERDLVPEDEA